MKLTEEMKKEIVAMVREEMIAALDSNIVEEAIKWNDIFKVMPKDKYTKYKEAYFAIADNLDGFHRMTQEFMIMEDNDKIRAVVDAAEQLSKAITKSGLGKVM